MWYTNSIVPEMLKTLLLGSEVISFAGYMAQFYFFGSMVVVKCFLLAVMSYDHYLVICSPLWCPFLMNLHTCILLSGGCGSWLGGFLTLWSLPAWLSIAIMCSLWDWPHSHWPDSHAEAGLFWAWDSRENDLPPGLLCHHSVLSIQYSLQ